MEGVLEVVVASPEPVAGELGRLQVSLEGEILVDRPLVAVKAVEQSGLFSRFVDWIVLFITQLLS